MESTIPISLADRILALRRLAVDHFLEEDWQTLAQLTSTEEVVNRHDQHLGRVNWGEEAYDALVLQVLEEIARRDEGNVAVFEEYAETCSKQTMDSPYSRASLLRVER